MREVSPGDLILCFYEGRIRSVGIALSYCFDAPKPAEFGAKGAYWEAFGHRITAQFIPCPNPVRPKDHIALLRPHLAAKYAPLQHATGNGLQAVYLASISETLAELLLGLAHFSQAELRVERERALQLSVDYDGTSITGIIEDAIVREVRSALNIEDTVRQSIIDARRGQGQFRRDVLDLERRCRVTRIQDPEHLLASHIKPWRSCADASERLDGNNGLALSPHVDHLFDKGFLSFSDQGDILTSPLVSPAIWDAFHVDPSKQVGAFRDGQLEYLAYHRQHTLRRVV
jgi:hypothetical protein